MKRISPLGLQITQLLLRGAHSQVVSGVVLLLATAVALIAANWHDSRWIHTFFDRAFPFHFFHYNGSFSLHFLVNEVGMTFFFLLVGIEIKREFLVGELASVRKGILPVVAALGGMILPASIYLAFCHGTPFAKGWGIPMATDIAFAGGMLALLGKRVPLWAKVYLTSLAIVDDIGSVLVIAIFYTGALSWVALALAGTLVLVMILLRYLGVKQTWVYLLLGVPLWGATLFSGIHVTLAGLITAFLLPQNRTSTNEPFFAYPLERYLHAIVVFMILPLFALCNASIILPLSLLWSSIHHPMTQAIFFGLLLGKPIGIFGFSFFAVKLKLAQLPYGASWMQVLGLAFVAGIGFTMSLFIAQLSFTNPALQEFAKIGILFGSLAAIFIGSLLLLGSQFRSTFGT